MRPDDDGSRHGTARAHGDPPVHPRAQGSDGSGTDTSGTDTPDGGIELPAVKRAARREARAVRARAHAQSPAAARDLAACFIDAIDMPRRCAVSTYHAIGDELDVGVLSSRLVDAGHEVALPVVAGADSPLGFRRWRPGDRMVDGVLGIPVPPPSAPAVVPEVLVIPLLAFDDDGYRLGYGGGYYDRTLASLRQRNPQVLAVGVAFEGQRIPRVPREAHDEPLDWLVSEVRARRIGSGATR